MLELRRLGLIVTTVVFAACIGSAGAQQTPYPKPTELPNPYRLVERWPTLAQEHEWRPLGRGHQGACRTQRQHLGLSSLLQHGAARQRRLHQSRRGQSADPGIRSGGQVFSRALAWGCSPILTGSPSMTTATCGRATSTTPRRCSACRPRNADGVVMGQEVLKLSPAGKVLMTLGKEGVSGNGPDTFDRPTGVAVAPNGDIFVSDGHSPNKHNTARVVKFSKDGRFIKAWGHKGTAPGEFDEPHDIFIGGSQNRVYVADRRNSRIQVFDQDGKFIAAWKQFGQPSSVFVGKDDTIYVGASFPIRQPKKRRTQRHRGRQRQRRLAEGLHSRPVRPRQGAARHVRVRHCG